MFEAFTNHIFSFLEVFKYNQITLYVCAFALALLESVPVIGVFIPGTVTLLLFGVFVAKGFGALWVVVLVAVLGAFIGDSLGYLLGKYGRRFFKEHSRLLKLSHIQTGEAFFVRHGRKSVLFGRFVGPIRPIVSMVAGASHMPIDKFLFWNMSGAILWVGLYVVLGYVFGDNIQLIDRIVSDIGTGVIVLLLIGAGFYLYFKKRAKIMKD